MKFLKTNINGCFIIEPKLIEDNRGSFFRTFCEEMFKDNIEGVYFKQMNHSINHLKGTFRGMHYQSPPHAEGKLIRCVKGKVIDFYLDVREGSPTFLHYGKEELSADNKKMIYLCKGIAHGFLTVEDNSELIYHHTESYSKEAERGIRFSDPKLGFELPFPIEVISEKDINYPFLTNNFTGIKI